MLNFDAGTFAIAGLLAAAGPIIIHLLNRRRFRTVSWAAMDFLREALQRNRRILQFRDLLLLALRVLCVLFFGMALARPFLTGSGVAGFLQTAFVAVAVAAAFGAALWAVVASARRTRVVAGAICGIALLASVLGVSTLRQAQGETGVLSSRQPVHAVLVIDNSLSMARETVGGNLLDRAKERAREFIDALPGESRVSVLPLCGADAGFTLDAYRNRDDARDAVDRIEVLDLAGSAAEGLELAERACTQVPELRTKRIVYLGDLQATNWSGDTLATVLVRLPELQIAPVGDGDEADNVWISDLHVQDGVADIETPATFTATIRSSGESALSGVQVTFSIDGAEVASQAIDLEPGQEREVQFTHQFDLPVEPGEPVFSVAALRVQTESAEGDRLARDNTRYVAVPVVAALPVVFVDQHGGEESLERNRIGETYRLRHLLAPRTAGEDFSRRLIRIRHVRIDQLDRELLADARLVVIAGVESPETAVPLLREYVEQGGQLVIAAGAGFDPREWNDAAWQDGLGILPGPLAAEAYGVTPEEATRALNTFFLDFNSLQNEFFLIEGESRETLQDLYRLPIFFKAVQMDLGTEAMGRLVASEARRIEANRTQVAVSEQPDSGTSERQQQGEENEQTQTQPQWLLWRQPAAAADRTAPAETLASRSRPRVLASFENDLPFLVERRIDRGRVMFASSGVFSSWNTLTQTNAILIFDRIFRGMLEETLPVRTHGAGDRIALPVEPGRQLRYTLRRPEGREETLAVEALGPDAYGVHVRRPVRSGEYRIAGYERAAEGTGNPARKVEDIALAVNGPERESSLEALSAEQLAERLGNANYRLLGTADAIPLEGAQFRGQDLWKMLIVLVLVCLLAEMLVLAWPSFRKEPVV